MSLDIPVREQRPAIGIWMLPSLVPVRLGEPGSSAVNNFHGGEFADAVLTRCYPHNWPVFPVEVDVVCLEVASPDAVEVPEFSETRPEGPWDGAKGGREELVEKSAEDE